MADCECLQGCPFFNDKMPMDSGIGALYKRNYCKGDNTRCARYMVFKALGKPKVPNDLYPNNLDKATKLIEQG
ncbi:hypothetical protein [Phosphitispora sp. TUW77]|uniref:hypothetical protein n=1 Tax=Phosphitispora sp. TUW77 TaxID=3152361 RepID=UPI003AB679EA